MTDIIFEDGPLHGRVLRESAIAEKRKVFLQSKDGHLYYLAKNLYFSLANTRQPGYTTVVTGLVYRHVKDAQFRVLPKEPV